MNRNLDSSDSNSDGLPRLSYKFQRLREEIRVAILRGEFRHRLPGERVLGRRYGANAKTVNKALCDLTGEGLLVRHIGRGTFVAAGRWQGGDSRQSYTCLRHLCAPEQPGPAEILARLRDDLADQGHNLHTPPPHADAKSCSVPLRAWAARTRSSTHGLFGICDAPLDGRVGGLDDKLVMEAHRRQVPIVMLGACALGPKLNAIVPDFVDAGYRLSEHLLRLGCEAVVAVCGGGDGREVDAVLNGCRTAATRYGGGCGRCAAEDMRVRKTAIGVAEVRGSMPRPEATGRIGPVVGVLCIGRSALEAVRGNEALMWQWRGGDLAVVCALDAGDSTAEALDWTAYEVGPRQIADWGARLMADLRPGRRPVEIVIPGQLQIRNSISPEAGHPERTVRPARTGSTAAPMAEVSI